MTRGKALLIVFFLWAAIFLPGLGSVEIKGEEGRRILPAVTMLETGNWIVPYIGGRPYLRKPPLLQWLIGASFSVSGTRNEWTARAPSALSVLALALVIVGVASEWLTPGGALTAALFSMTNLGILEKGRLSEIEALYISLFGTALVTWLAWWHARRSPWMVWTVPFILLGLGLLAKGPLHLVFFYAPVAGILWRSNRLRELRGIPHIVGIVIMVGIFASWAIVYLHQVQKLNPAQVWGAEFAGRVGNRPASFRLWLENFWNNFENFVPWITFVPLWWNRRIVASMEPDNAAIMRGAGTGVAICFCALVFIPGVVSRYLLPLIVPASILNALILRAAGLVPARIFRWWRVGLAILFIAATVGAVALPFLSEFRASSFLAMFAIAVALTILGKQRRTLTSPLHLSVATAVLIAAGVLIFVIAEVPRLKAAETARPLGRLINDALREETELYVVDAGYEPALFYVRPRCIYVLEAKDLPPREANVLIRANALKKVEKLQRKSRLLTRFVDPGHKEFLLLHLEAPPPNLFL